MPNEAKPQLLAFKTPVASQVTQAMLQRHLELQAALKFAKADYKESKHRITEALRSGATVEPGFLAAVIVAREQLLVGC